MEKIFPQLPMFTVRKKSKTEPCHVHYVIIGGGIAGTTSAETIRAHDPEGSIAIISDEPYRLYSRIMLPKPNFFLGQIPFEKIWLKKEDWYADNRIAFYSGKRAIKLNTQKKSVTLDDATVLTYEKLLIATGSYARKWPIAGAEKKGITYLRSLDHAKEIMESIKTAKRAVAIGSGFISFEMCDMLKRAGLEVAMVMREPYYWYPVLDEVSGRMIEKKLEQSGITLMRTNEVQVVRGSNRVESVQLTDGTVLSCDLILAGIGVVYDTAWLKNAGLRTNRGVIANEYLEASAKDVWVAGDVAEFQDVILRERIQQVSWSNAYLQGKTAGLNMSCRRQVFKLVSSYTSHGFDMVIGFVGDIRVTPKREVVTRGSADVNSYGRIILEDDRIVGATLINRMRDAGPLTKLVEQNINMAARKRELADPNFQLASLIANTT